MDDGKDEKDFNLISILNELPDCLYISPLSFSQIRSQLNL